MNKSELIDAMADSADISKAAAGRALDGLVDAITEAMKKGDTVSLIGFDKVIITSGALKALEEKLA
jgi:DNA-binding protein HU-beta